MEAEKIVAIALSGGVDSAVSALLLKKGLVIPEPCRLIGVTFWLFDGQEEYLEKARSVAQFLGIEHQIFDLRALFKERVIKAFLEGYLQGITPNPCALCNRLFKFGIVPELVKANLKAHYYATGHYVRKAEYKGYPLLKVSANRAKDQSYFLALIKRDIIPQLIFPVGTFTSKEEVKKLALAEGLSFSQESESQDVCFLQGRSLREYLREHFKETEGEIIYKGKVVGKHKGFYFYTIGQRKGLNVPLGRPLYVIRIDAENNRIYLGEEEELARDTFWLEDINFHLPFERWGEVTLQVRYRSERVPLLKLSQVGPRWHVLLAKPVKRVTPGQVCAFYEGDLLLGGGIIAKDI